MEKVLHLLLQEEYVSGEEISRQLGVTRAAVWKKIEQLRQAGLAIEGGGKRGYTLQSTADSVFAPIIAQGLKTQWAGREIVYLPRVDSTNSYAKKLACEGAAHGTLVIAQEQTQGRGRRGRDWSSPAADGIFMSLLVRPPLHPAQSAQLTLVCALGVAKAVRTVCALEAGIKWPNDVVVQGKKVCGILLEMNASDQDVEYVVSGVGLNVHQKAFPEEFRKTAASLDMLGKAVYSRATLVRAFLGAYEEYYAQYMDGGPDALMPAYRELSVTLGKQVRVIDASGNEFQGTAVDMEPSGALVVEEASGKRHTVLAGDVSVRGLMGYV